MQTFISSTHQVTGQNLLPVVAVIITVVNEIQVGISEVQQVVRVIDGQAVGPVHFVAYDDGPQFPVHAGPLNAGIPPPVGPEHQVSAARQKARLLSPLLLTSTQKKNISAQIVSCK